MRYELWLYSIPGFTGTKCRRLLEQGISAEEIFHLSKEQTEKLSSLTEADRSAVAKARKNLDPQWLRGELLEKGISFVSLGEKEYPRRLRQIPDPPFGLYYRGRLPGNERAMAIVGSRARSEYGRQAARLIGRGLARAGIAVVSGLALGIDADGHKGALEGGGYTAAVLGCGVDVCYPAGNRFLYDRILEQGGGILSEYHPGQPPMARLFPARNRIISGLCEGVIVVEARQKSGSLITADYATEQGRDVWALPGRVSDPLSGGCNQLIRQGAGIICDPAGFPAEIVEFRENQATQIDFQKFLLEKDEQLVYSLLDFCPKGTGALMEESGLSLDGLLEVLGRLMERDFICEILPGHYVRHI